MKVALTVENFDKEVFNSSLPVIVDFWAAWCGPCQKIAPYVDNLAKEYEGKIKVCKLNVDEAPGIATRYMVMSIPTLMIFKDGKVMEKKVGSVGKRDLEKFIAPYISQG